MKEVNPYETIACINTGCNDIILCDLCDSHNLLYSWTVVVVRQQGWVNAVCNNGDEIIYPAAGTVCRRVLWDR